jgi:hypothetical protein
MARPPQFAYPENDSLAVAKAKSVIKELGPEARAHIMAWLVKFYGDTGMMYSPTITRRRKRVKIDDTEFWLVRVPKKEHP